MKRPLSLFATALVSILATAGANAQENTVTLACQEFGANSYEPLLGDEDHRLQVVDYTCLVTAGPMSGGVGTGRDILEIESGVWRLLTGDGVIRKPGATAVYVKTDKGHGHYVLAVGSAAFLLNKSFTLNIKEGVRQFSVVQKLD